MRPLSYPQTDVFLVMFSIVSPPSFENVRKLWIPELDRHVPGIPRILVGVKKGLREDVKVLEDLRSKGMQPVRSYEGLDLAKEIGAYSYIECDALTKDNLHRPFDEVILTSTDSRLAC